MNPEQYRRTAEEYPTVARTVRAGLWIAVGVLVLLVALVVLAVVFPQFGMWLAVIVGGVAGMLAAPWLKGRRR